MLGGGAYGARATFRSREMSVALVMDLKGWRIVNESTFDEATRALGAEQNRRGALRALAGLTIGSVAGLGLAGRASAAVGDAPSFGFLDNAVGTEGNKKKKRRLQRKKKKCKKRANSCRIGAASYCTATYLFPAACFASLSNCCSHLAKCKNGQARACIANSPY